MERVANAMQMDRIAADIGFDMSGDAIIARAEQLAKMEADALADRSTQVYSLQRKGKNMKQQLESKELHLDMLRKKIASLEERLVGKSEIESEKDSETMKVRKLKKLCEKYQAEIVESRQESERLKARLLESTTYKVDTLSINHLPVIGILMFCFILFNDWAALIAEWLVKNANLTYKMGLIDTLLIIPKSHFMLNVEFLINRKIIRL